MASAWFAAGGLLLVLVGLSALLPGPADLLTVSGSGAATVDAAVLAGAALLVWALTAWVAVVLTVALVGVLPGACGRHARRLLAHIAPRLALRLVAVAVGASALAGTTACSAPIFASATAPAAATAATTESTVTASPQVLDPSGAVVPAPTSAVPIDIDWPSAAGTPTVVPTPSAAPPSTAGTFPASVSTTTPPSSPDAAAAPSTTVSPSSAGATSPAAPSGAASPADASAPAATAAAPEPDPPSPAPGQVVTRPSGEPIVVRPGDTLWALAAEGLPDGAGDAAVDAAWHQWYALNRDVIGSDPDLLQPGQHLVPPPADAPTTDEETDR